MADERPVILVLDPDGYTWSIAQLVLGADFRVEQARNRGEIKAKAISLRPDLILCEDTLAATRDITVEPALREVRFLYISDIRSGEGKAGATQPDSVRRDRFRQELRKRVKDLIQSPPTALPDYFTLAVLIEEGRNLTVALSGRSSFLRQIPAFSLEECARAISQLAPQNIDGWQKGFDAAGMELYRIVFGSGELRRIRSEVMNAGALLKLSLIGKSELLKIPFELLTNPEELAPLAVRHTISRVVLDVSTKRPPISSYFFANLPKMRRPRVLLIGSDPVPATDIKVGSEIPALEHILRTSLGQQGFEPHIVAIKPDEASFDRVVSELSKPEWDIIHYAGHLDKASGHLSFFDSGHGAGKLKPLSVADLSDLLQESEVRFIYMNCCYGAEILGPALVSAGVPACLTFRWEHLGGALEKFALRFYEGLATLHDPELALLKARKDIFNDAELKRDLPLWASALLLRQS